MEKSSLESHRNEIFHENHLTFTKDKCEMLLHVAEANQISEVVTVFAQTNNLLPKNEYHVTLLGGKASSFISEKIKKLPNADETVFRERVERLMREFSWNFEYTNTYYYLRREYNDPDPVDVNKTIPEIRETIIQLVDVPDLRVLHQSLEELCGMENEIEALPHITIFSNSTREDKKQRGIGIYSEEDLNISNAQKI